MLQHIRTHCKMLSTSSPLAVSSILGCYTVSVNMIGIQSARETAGNSEGETETNIDSEREQTVQQLVGERERVCVCVWKVVLHRGNDLAKQRACDLQLCDHHTKLGAAASDMVVPYTGHKQLFSQRNRHI